MSKIVSAMAAALGAMVLAVSAFTGAALASEPSGFSNTLLHGTGVLDAHGTGVAAVKGTIEVHVRSAEGILLVKDESGDASIDVQGDGGTALWRGFKVYFGFNGEATIRGTNVAVIVVGRDIDLHAAGHGWAYLKGNGTFTVNGRGPFPWSEDGRLASLTP